MSTWLTDVRYALRALAHSPGFTAIVLLTVAVGTGANAAVFSFVNALLFRPASGVSDPSHLVAVFTSDFSSGPYGSSSYPDFRSMQEDRATFASLAAYDSEAAIMSVAGGAERIRSAAVTGEFFSVTGVRARIGRTIEARDADSSVALISDDLWRRTFGGGPDVVGKTLALDGEVRTIVGVAPSRFNGLDLGDRIDVWVPMIAPPDTPAERDRRGLSIVGRLAPGVNVTEAQVRLNVLAAQLAAAYPDTNLGTLDRPNDPRPMVVLRHTRLPPQFRGEAGAIGALLLVATSLVLLIACANVASLLLSRATARRREVAVRFALGATRARLVRQLITESLVLGTAGGALGLLGALWFAGALPSFFPPEQAEMIDARVDRAVLLFAVAVSIGASLLFGLVPAWHTREGAAVVALRGAAGGASEAPGGLRARNGLVIAQAALSCVLLISTGLLVRSLVNTIEADLGFGTRQAVVASVEVPSAIGETEGAEYFRAATEQLRALPGVEAAAVVSALPLSLSGRRGFRIEGYVPKAGEGTELNVNVVGPSYFDTIGIPVTDGRAFDDRDTAGSRRVIVVNDVLAARYFGGRAVGRHLVDSLNADLEIVGVVRSGAYLTVREPPVAFVYYPLAQAYRPRLSFVARSALDPATLVETVRRTLARVRSDVAVYRITTLEAHLSEAVVTDRLSAALVGMCGLLATVLAAVGVYGVMAYAVVRRRREIAVRIALGAERWQIIRLVFGGGLSLTAIGMVVGLAGAAAGTRLLSSMLYGVGSTDGATFVTVPLLLTAMTVLAGIVPVTRALRLDPMSVLRQE